MRRRASSKAETVAHDVAALAASPRKELRAAWRRLYRSQPPKFLSRDILELGIAWKLQERALGGLSAATQRQLNELARTVAIETVATVPRQPRLKPGAKLIREWGGETHIVLVTEDGFHWRDQTWRSLSAIARAITGAQWSGPRFFGIWQKSTSNTEMAEGSSDAP